MKHFYFSACCQRHPTNSKPRGNQNQAFLTVFKEKVKSLLGKHNRFRLILLNHYLWLFF